MAIQTNSTNSYLTQKIQQGLTQTQGKISQLADEVSSGKISGGFAGLAKSMPVEGYISSKDIATALESKLRSNKALQSKVEEIWRVERALSDVIKDSMRLCQKASDPTIANTLNIAGLAQSQLSNIQLLLNSSFQGQKLFAGGKTDIVETVGDIVNNSNLVLGNATANYYNGDDFIQSFAINPNMVVEYGVRANEPVFQKLIAAHHHILGGNLTTAMGMLQQTKSELSALISSTGNNATSIAERINADNETLLGLEAIIAGAENADILDSISQLSQLETQLRASFMLTNRLADLSLVNYLK